MTENTPFDNKCSILSEFWLNYRSEDDFEDFIEYNDIGLPLAFMIAEDIVKSNHVAEAYITECWDLLCLALTIDPKQNYTSLDDMFLDSGAQED